MKFGIRTPSLSKKLSARTSLKRVVRHNMGLKAPKGLGVLTDPKKALYNSVYNKTTVSAGSIGKGGKKGKKTQTQAVRTQPICPACQSMNVKTSFLLKMIPLILVGNFILFFFSVLVGIAVLVTWIILLGKYQHYTCRDCNKKW